MRNYKERENLNSDFNNSASLSQASEEQNDLVAYNIQFNEQNLHNYKFFGAGCSSMDKTKPQKKSGMRVFPMKDSAYYKMLYTSRNNSKSRLYPSQNSRDPHYTSLCSQRQNLRTQNHENLMDSSQYSGAGTQELIE